MITVSSLLECNDPTDTIPHKIKRALPISLLLKALTDIYTLHERYNESYSKAFFLTYESEDYDEKNAYIIEMGFLIFFILSILSEKKENLSFKEDEEEIENLEALKSETIGNKGMVGNLLSNFTILNQGFSFGKTFLNTGFDYMKKLKKNIVGIAKDSLTNREKNQLEELQKLKKSMEFKELKSRALNFFKIHSAHIEIQRYSKSYKIYFPLLPECANLPKAIKREFHEKVNRASVKTKVSGLMDESDYFTDVMVHEDRLKGIFNKNRFLAIVATYEKFWENLSFYITLFLNFIIIASYSEDKIQVETPPYEWDYYRLEQPEFFSLSSEETLSLFKILGFLNLVFSSLSILLFVMKRGPILTGKIWRSLEINLIENQEKIHYLNKGILYGKAWVSSFKIYLTDFTMLFYLLYLVFIILGLTVHPFFYAFHLTDFLRIAILKNVLKAIWNPKMQILLTLVFFILVEYYFTLISYSFFSDHYYEAETTQATTRILFNSSLDVNSINIGNNIHYYEAEVIVIPATTRILVNSSIDGNSTTIVNNTNGTNETNLSNSSLGNITDLTNITLDNSTVGGNTTNLSNSTLENSTTGENITDLKNDTLGNLTNLSNNTLENSTNLSNSTSGNITDLSNSSTSDLNNSTSTIVHWRCETLWQCFFSTYDFTFKVILV